MSMLKRFARALGAALLCMATVNNAMAAAVTYYHNDISGSPIAATDAAGNLKWKESYKPYGDKLTRSAASSDNKIGFHGKAYDDSTGLSYMGARYYDPILGRFTGVDPQGFDPESLHSFNRYAYVNNNPYRYVDPDGHSPIDVVFLAIDVGKLGFAIYTGVGVPQAAADVVASAIGVVSPVPFTGAALKVRNAERAIESAQVAKTATEVSSKELRNLGRAQFQQNRAEVLKENGGKCVYCGQKDAVAGDHVKSLKSYADDVNAGRISKTEAVQQANSKSNLAGACTSCNSSKGSKTISPDASGSNGTWIPPIQRK